MSAFLESEKGCHSSLHQTNNNLIESSISFGVIVDTDSSVDLLYVFVTEAFCS